MEYVALDNRVRLQLNTDGLSSLAHSSHARFKIDPLGPMRPFDANKHFNLDLWIFYKISSIKFIYNKLLGTVRCEIQL